jgi:uncharacterized protein (DUF2141 family)
MKFLFGFLACLLTLPLFAQHKIEITIHGIETIQGHVLVALYDSEREFMKKHLDSRKAKVNGNQVTVVFENLRPGDYAISTFHDKNDNEKLDTNFIGIPVEMYGFSNNAKGSFGPPSFGKAKVLVENDKKLSINLR